MAASRQKRPVVSTLAGESLNAQSRSFQTRRPTKATSPPCSAASETSVEDGVLLSSLPLTLDFASAAVGSTMFARRLATQVTRERHKPLLSSRT